MPIDKTTTYPEINEVMGTEGLWVIPGGKTSLFILRISAAVFILGISLCLPGFGVLALDDQILHKTGINNFIAEPMSALNTPGLFREWSIDC